MLHTKDLKFNVPSLHEPENIYTGISLGCLDLQNITKIS